MSGFTAISRLALASRGSSPASDSGPVFDDSFVSHLYRSSVLDGNLAVTGPTGITQVGHSGGKSVVRATSLPRGRRRFAPLRSLPAKCKGENLPALSFVVNSRLWIIFAVGCRTLFARLFFWVKLETRNSNQIQSSKLEVQNGIHVRKQSMGGGNGRECFEF